MGKGENIKSWRERRSYSQEELAGLAGVSANAIWRIENGTHSPRPKTLRKIAEALKIDVEVLLESTAPAPTTNGAAVPGAGDGE